MATFVGIDVSQASLDGFVFPSKAAFRFSNSEEGISQLIAYLKPLAPTRIVFEATGDLEMNLACELKQENLPFYIVNPRNMRDFAKALGILAKTDQLDAQVIARYAEMIEPKPQQFPEEATRELEELVVRRKQLVEMASAEKNRLSLKKQSKRNQESIKSHLDWLKHRIKELNKEIKTKIKKSDHWREKDELIQGIKGLGDQTSRKMLALIPELGTVNGKEIAALIGIAPYNQDSGKTKGKKTCYGGRKEVREAMYMAALVAVRWNEAVKAVYDRLRARGKAAKVALIACARKLAVSLNAMLRDKTPWDPKKFARAG